MIRSSTEIDTNAGSGCILAAAYENESAEVYLARYRHAIQTGDRSIVMKLEFMSAFVSKAEFLGPRASEARDVLCGVAQMKQRRKVHATA